MSSLRIAYQGIAGAFGEQAARQFAGDDANLLPCRRFEDTFEAVVSGRASRGVIPIENSLAGSVHACYDLLAAHELVIAAETVVRISHALIAPTAVEFRDVRRVLSHPMALLQCERFFQEHPALEAVAVENTAAAVRDAVAGGRRDTAAIGSLRAAELHGGAVLEENLEDDPMNFTRFLLVARQEDPAPGGCGARPRKTSLLFRLANRPGALFDSLRPFSNLGINLAKIESRPVRGSRFEYFFYLDAIEPRGRGRDVESAIRSLEGCTKDLRRLGTYPVAEAWPG